MTIGSVKTCCGESQHDDFTDSNVIFNNLAWYPHAQMTSMHL